MEAAWVVVWNTRNVRKGCYHINDGYSLISGEDVIQLVIKQQSTLSFSSLEEEWCSFSTSSGFSATTSASLSMLSSIPATSTGCSSANTSGPQCRQSTPRISPGRTQMGRVAIHEEGLGRLHFNQQLESVNAFWVHGTVPPQPVSQTLHVITP